MSDSPLTPSIPAIPASETSATSPSAEVPEVPESSVHPAGAPSARLELGGDWQRVSPRYVLVEIVGNIVFGVISVVAALVLWFLAGQTWALFVGGALALIAILSVIFEPRRVRAIGYRLRDDDLLFRRGILFQRFVSVPYGRMQLVDITRGPVARWLGLADLKFVTAAASTGVSIPGLNEADAELLRDRLVELAESRRAGL